ncbi:MAG: hypothetical protein EZS28_001488 [Streblomastix strix]|uniref:Uncharacterized protein n=1 Tax=Streblomastix strix TaxID=222440 RepID=A0A5J4X7H2_9EUKA|nr:MAG: hypothetical protein EZS28_001488 [Streblomastix strix]
MCSIAQTLRNQEISTFRSELDDIIDELRYYEQSAADRNAAKEQADTQNFELDRRCNIPTLYDKNGRRLRTKKKKLIAGNYVYE